jgi:hypothetical protein
MIDTDKYEGHAEGEWTIEMNDTGDECQIIAQDYGTIAQTFYRDHDKLFNATTKLMADAPLLLEEVKRLREVIKKIKDCATINAQHDDILEQREWEYILELIE